jgi:hypothetical protein
MRIIVIGFRKLQNMFFNFTRENSMLIFAEKILINIDELIKRKPLSIKFSKQKLVILK